MMQRTEVGAAEVGRTKPFLSDYFMATVLQSRSSSPLLLRSFVSLMFLVMQRTDL